MCEANQSRKEALLDAINKGNFELYQRAIRICLEHNEIADLLLLHTTVQLLNIPILEDLLTIKDIDVNNPNKYGITALHMACLKPLYVTDKHEEIKLKIVKILIKAGANINSVTQTNCTPLHLAVTNRFYAIAKYLIECGADRTVINDKELTARAIVVKNNSIKFVNWLDQYDLPDVKEPVEPEKNEC